MIRNLLYNEQSIEIADDCAKDSLNFFMKFKVQAIDFSFNGILDACRNFAERQALGYGILKKRAALHVLMLTLYESQSETCQRNNNAALP